jgi:hypothetical protein
MVKDCPKCGLVNPPEAARCDCGYDFVQKVMQQSYLDPNKHFPVGAALGGAGAFVVIVIIVIRVLLLLASAAGR